MHPHQSNSKSVFLRFAFDSHQRSIEAPNRGDQKSDNEDFSEILLKVGNNEFLPRGGWPRERGELGAKQKKVETTSVSCHNC